MPGILRYVLLLFLSHDAPIFGPSTPYGVQGAVTRNTFTFITAFVILTHEVCAAERLDSLGCGTQSEVTASGTGAEETCNREMLIFICEMAVESLAVLPYPEPWRGDAGDAGDASDLSHSCPGVSWVSTECPECPKCGVRFEVPEYKHRAS